MFTVLNGYFGVVSVNFRLQEKSCVKKGKLTTDVVVKFFGKVFKVGPRQQRQSNMTAVL
jgi:hypothetical protein